MLSYLEHGEERSGEVDKVLVIVAVKGDAHRGIHARDEPEDEEGGGDGDDGRERRVDDLAQRPEVCEQLGRAKDTDRAERVERRRFWLQRRPEAGEDDAARGGACEGMLGSSVSCDAGGYVGSAKGEGRCTARAYLRGVTGGTDSAGARAEHGAYLRLKMFQPSLRYLKNHSAPHPTMISSAKRHVNTSSRVSKALNAVLPSVGRI